MDIDSKKGSWSESALETLFGKNDIKGSKSLRLAKTR
jgi:hypothetical protein